MNHEWQFVKKCQNKVQENIFYQNLFFDNFNIWNTLLSKIMSNFLKHIIHRIRKVFTKISLSMLIIIHQWRKSITKLLRNSKNVDSSKIDIKYVTHWENIFTNWDKLFNPVRGD